MIIIFVGISGSGKSTVAASHAKRNKNLVIVNRDKIREMDFSLNEDNIQDYVKMVHADEYIQIIG